MKTLLLLLLICVTLPAGALNYTALERAITAAPVDEPIYQIYTADTALNAKRAIRLGYQHFQTRINTPKATVTDTQIALLITTRFQPFFDKLNQLEQMPPDKRPPALTRQYTEQFTNLAIELTRLLLKNQHRYSHTTFLDSSAALQETILIIQEAANRGTF